MENAVSGGTKEGMTGGDHGKMNWYPGSQKFILVH